MTRILPVILSMLGLACGRDRPLPAEVSPQGFLLLAHHPESMVGLTLPADSREGAEPPELIPFDGRFQLRRVVAGVGTWEIPLPFRSRALFFTTAPEGMKLESGGKALQYKYFSDEPGTWAFSGSYIRVRGPLSVTPEPVDYELSYAPASQRERELNRAWATATTDKAFALRSLQQDDTNRFGLFLPAPAQASWKLVVPEAGRFSAELGLLDPEIEDLPPSDGARFTLLLQDGEQEWELLSTGLRQSGEFREVHADLARWAGQEVTLSLRTEPSGDTISDYVFLGEPLVYTPSDNPPRVFLLFLDTLRRDHVGMHGYERDTTPELDRFGQGAVVFDDARAPSPWTLPSTRALLLGHQPELWGAMDDLPALLGRRGWSSAAFVGNIYLSSNFDMEGGWGTHRCVNWPRAEVQVDRLFDWLDAHDDRPTVSMVNFMDAHLPYREPVLDRLRFAQSMPEDLRPGFARTEIVLSAKGSDRQEVQGYIKDRYDSSVRYLDRQVGRVLDRTEPGDIVVIFSDHGEEFWEHGSFEHGHTLYEELLRVVMTLRAPGVDPALVSEPVTLLDLLPTLAELLGDDTLGERDGRSLLGLVRGEAAEKKLFRNRKIGFGRPLYGREQWGVLHRGRKYTSSSGAEHLFDLKNDPMEKHDLVRKDDVDLEPWHRRMSEGLGFPVETVFRVLPEMGTIMGPVEVEMVLPTGIEAAWVGVDATRQSQASVEVEGDRLKATWKGGFRGTRELFVAPVGDPVQAAEQLEMSVTVANTTRDLELRQPIPEPDGTLRRLGSVTARGITLSLNFAVVPRPPSDANMVEGFDSESEAALKALGYIE